MPEALVTPTLLRWARERCDMTREQLAASTKYRLDLLEDWERDRAKPSLAQARTLASKLNVPLGYLFLEKPPELPLPVADLRVVDPDQREEMSLNCRQLLDDCLVKQDWYRDFLLEEGAEPLPFVGSFSLASRPASIAVSIRDTLNLKELVGPYSRAPSWDQYGRELIRRTEDAGVTVISTGIVGNNTHRTIGVEECRGFALPDPIAPLVFVHSGDYQVSRIFTLIHELAHVWIAKGGVSNADPESASDEPGLQKIERVCNQVSAEVLVPQDELRALWTPWKPLNQQISELNTHFRVSAIVVLRRAADLGLVSREEFSQQVQMLRRRTEKPSKPQRGNFKNSFPLRSGRNILSAVLAASINGQLPINEAARMLAVKTSTIANAIKRSGLR